MRLVVAAIGRLKAGPEADLAARYQDRAMKAGRALGFRGLSVIDHDESRAADVLKRKAEEAETLARAGTGRIVALDETGLSMSSTDFARQLAKWRDAGSEAAIFMLGGPDGLDGGLRKRADLVLNLGTMTWPHQIARILLIEQIYRAMTILSGHPYHRN